MLGDIFALDVDALLNAASRCGCLSRVGVVAFAQLLLLAKKVAAQVAAAGRVVIAHENRHEFNVASYPGTGLDGRRRLTLVAAAYMLRLKKWTEI